jgi:hypothetical protein
MRDHGVPLHVSAAIMGHSETKSVQYDTTAHQAGMDDAMDTVITTLGGVRERNVTRNSRDMAG